jgi:hypothetical protein
MTDVFFLARDETSQTRIIDFRPAAHFHGWKPHRQCAQADVQARLCLRIHTNARRFGTIAEPADRKRQVSGAESAEAERALVIGNRADVRPLNRNLRAAQRAAE